jgi:glycerophosphoryl diester phosphodiesterase
VSVWRDGAPLVVGHRGGRGPGWPPENTLAAFDRARLEGARAIELDVRTCAEGEAVVFHDPTLRAMSGSSDIRSVADQPLSTLRALDLGGGARIPTLSEALEWARGVGMGVNVELKSDVPNRRELVRATARSLRACPADVLLSSFDPRLLARIAAWAPSAPRALLTHVDQSRWVSVLQELVRPPLVSALHLERLQAGAQAVHRYAGRGLWVGVWTVNDPAEAVDLVRRGARWIITDRTGPVLQALRSANLDRSTGPSTGS